jgi:hypothetical protein
MGGSDKQTLRKALSLSEKLKRKAQFEREVSRALELRNQQVRYGAVRCGNEIQSAVCVMRTVAV